jgi:cytochrome c
MYRGRSAFLTAVGVVLTSSFAAANPPDVVAVAPGLSAQPAVSIHVSGNRSFYWNNRRIRYLVVTEDPGVGDSLHGTLPADQTSVHVGYVNSESPLPAEFFAAGGQTGNIARAQAIIHRADCLLCHTIDGGNVVPSFTAIARSTRDDPASRLKFATVIAKGGSTSIGGIQMPPHASLSEADIGSLIDFILTLRDTDNNPRPVPMSGELVEHPLVAPSRPPMSRPAPAAYVVAAAYRRRDVPAEAAPTAVAELRLRSPRLSADEVSGSHGMKTASVTHVGPVKVAARAGAYVYFDDIDLTGVSTIEVTLARDPKRSAGASGRIVLRADGAGGPTVGETEVDDAPGNDSGIRLPIAIRRSEGFHRLYVVLEDSVSHKAQATFVALEIFPSANSNE